MILFVLGFCLSLPLNAQKHHPKSYFWQLGIGNTYVYDDYLSPLPHEGLSLLFRDGSMKPLKWGIADSLETTFDNAKWFRQFSFSLNPVYAKSRVGSSLYHGNMDLRCSVLKQVIDQPVWNVSAGAFLAVGGGGRYCVENGNNPGSVDLYTNGGITVFSDYQFTLWKKPMKLTYQGGLALAGLAFSPEYAESYYEIFYLGNSRNTIKFTNPLNTQEWRQQLSLDIPLSGRKSSFRLSWWNDGRISLLNNIRTRVLSTHFSVGYIRYFNVL